MAEEGGEAWSTGIEVRRRPGASATAVAVAVAVTPSRRPTALRPSAPAKATAAPPGPQVLALLSAATTAPPRPQVLTKGDTLLCTQRWRNGAAAGAPPAWRLVQHRTIPYSVETDAGAALRCDRRGCVGLQRSGLRGAPGMPGDGMS